MVSRAEIKTRYRSYVEDYPENTGMSFESENDTEYPIQDRVLGGDTFASVYLNQFANESAYLFELDNRVPSIRQLSVGLLPTVATELNKALFVQITHDHLAFWEYTRDLISHPNTAGSEIPDHLVDLFAHVLELARPDLDINNIGKEGLNDESAGCYLGYPLLEATAKWFASEYIDLDGTIKPGHEIQKLGRGSYGPPEDPNESNKCSDIGSLLFHVEEEVAGSEVKTHLEDVRRHVGELYRTSPDVVYGSVIKENRNTALHGETKAPAEIGIILNLTGLLIWSNYIY